MGDDVLIALPFTSQVIYLKNKNERTEIYRYQLNFESVFPLFCPSLQFELATYSYLSLSVP